MQQMKSDRLLARALTVVIEYDLVLIFVVLQMLSLLLLVPTPTYDTITWNYCMLIYVLGVCYPNYSLMN